MARSMLLQCLEDYKVIACYYYSFHNWSSKKHPPIAAWNIWLFYSACAVPVTAAYRWCYRCVWLFPRDPAGPAGEEAAQSVERQESPQALAAPLHPGQQPVPGGHQEALPASDGRELCERKPPPRQRQGGEHKGGNDQGSRGVSRQLKREWNLQTKEVSLSKLTVDVRGIEPNKCTYGASSHVRMFN